MACLAWDPPKPPGGYHSLLVAEAMGQARTSPKTLREIPCFASGEGSFMVLGIHRRPSLSLSLSPPPFPQPWAEAPM